MDSAPAWPRASDDDADEEDDFDRVDDREDVLVLVGFGTIFTLFCNVSSTTSFGLVLE